MTVNLAPAAEDANTPVPKTEAEYRKGLVSMDWLHDYSSDRAVWLRGKRQLAALAQARAQFDPSGAIWNEFATNEFKVVL